MYLIADAFIMLTFMNNYKGLFILTLHCNTALTTATAVSLYCGVAISQIQFNLG